MATLGGSSVVMQIQTALSKSLTHRCRELEDIIRNTSTKELRHGLPYIIESVFGFGSESGWNIDKIDKYRNIHEFESVRRFLAPDSPLLNLIYKLQGDPYLSYEFPIKCLPITTRQLIEDGIVPAFLLSKIQSQGYGQTFLSLGAFEYFLFHLTYCLVNPANQSTSWNNLYDFLYPNIIDDYISFFLPLDKKVLPPMPNLPSPVRSPVSHFTVPSSYSTSPTSVSPNTTPPRQRTRPSLFRSAFASQQKQHMQGSPVLDQSEAETWRSETLLQVFAEFWLNQNQGENGRPAPFPHSSFPTHVSYNRFATPYERDPFAYLFEKADSKNRRRMGSLILVNRDSYMPSLNQVKIVRLLVKYLHFFTNSATNIITSPYQTVIQSPLDEFKRNAVPQIVEKKLYQFLRHAFDRWPLDSSFRMVLETWLSYIQPWRYTDPNQYYLSKNPSRPDLAEVREKRIEDKWEAFIEENLLFYTVLFQQFLPRVFRLDMSSPQSAYMLYRVTKVFCLPNLAGLIFKAESWSYRSARMSHDLGASYLSPDHLTQLLPTLPPHLADLELPGYQYTPLFGENMNVQIHELLDQLIQARDSTLSQKATTKPKRQGLIGWLVSVFSDPYSSDMNDTRKLQLHLNQSLKNISEIFKIGLPEDIQEMTLPNEGDNSSLLEPTTPDCIDTNYGPILTDLGKYQVVNKLRKFDSTHHTDPDLQPIRSFENATLVRLLYLCCAFINTQFAGKLDSLYCRQDLLGRMAQVYFSPPLRPHQQIKSPISKQSAESMRQPRLSLRFLASYQTLIYLGILYIFLRLWLGAGPVEFVLIMVGLVLVYGFLKAMFRSSKSTVYT